MVRQDSEAARRYIERELKTHVCEPFIGLLVEKDGKQIGAVILNDYTPRRNIEATAASSGPWAVGDLRAIIRYCFERVNRITVRTSVHNTRAIYILEVMGFRKEGIMREFFDCGDAMVMGLLKSEQKIVRLRRSSLQPY